MPKILVLYKGYKGVFVRPDGPPHSIAAACEGEPSSGGERYDVFKDDAIVRRLVMSSGPAKVHAFSGDDTLGVLATSDPGSTRPSGANGSTTDTVNLALSHACAVGLTSADSRLLPFAVIGRVSCGLGLVELALFVVSPLPAHVDPKVGQVGVDKEGGVVEEAVDQFMIGDCHRVGRLGCVKQDEVAMDPEVVCKGITVELVHKINDVPFVVTELPHSLGYIQAYACW